MEKRNCQFIMKYSIIIDGRYKTIKTVTIYDINGLNTSITKSAEKEFMIFKANNESISNLVRAEVLFRMTL